MTEGREPKFDQSFIGQEKLTPEELLARLQEQIRSFPPVLVNDEPLRLFSFDGNDTIYDGDKLITAVVRNLEKSENGTVYFTFPREVVEFLYAWYLSDMAETKEEESPGSAADLFGNMADVIEETLKSKHYLKVAIDVVPNTQNGLTYEVRVLRPPLKG